MNNYNNINECMEFAESSNIKVTIDSEHADNYESLNALGHKITALLKRRKELANRCLRSDDVQEREDLTENFRLVNNEIVTLLCLYH